MGEGGTWPEPTQLLPHGAAMVFLTGIVEHSSEETACTVEVGRDTPFRTSAGLVPAWVGVEYMAQCIAAYGGLRARAQGEPAKLGFLLGSRRLVIHIPAFVPGQMLLVRARRLWGERGLFAFACSITDRVTGTCLMAGTLNVIRPDDPEALGRDAP